MITIQAFREAAARYNENPTDRDLQRKLDESCAGKRVIKRKPDGLIDIDESAEILTFALETAQSGEAGALTPAELFAQSSPQIEADPITGAPLRKGKTTQEPIIDWSRVTMELRKVVGYGAEKGEPLGGTPEQIAFSLSYGVPQVPPWPRLAKEWEDLEKKTARTDQEEALYRRVMGRLHFEKRAATSGLAAPIVFVNTSGPGLLRKLIYSKLKTDSDFEAFCMDWFPDMPPRFSNGMSRDIKINLLMQCHKEDAIVEALRRY